MVFQNKIRKNPKFFSADGFFKIKLEKPVDLSPQRKCLVQTKQYTQTIFAGKPSSISILFKWKSKHLGKNVQIYTQTDRLL